MALLSVIISIWLGHSYFKSGGKVRQVRYLLYFYVFFTLYNLSLLIPLWWGRGEFLALGYNFSILFLFIAAAKVARVPIETFFTVEWQEEWGRRIERIFLLVGVVTVAIQFLYPSRPLGDASGTLVFWHPVWAGAALTTLSMLAAAFMFGFAFFRGIFLTADRALKMRSLLMSLGSFFLGAAAFYYFRADQIREIITAFVFAIGGLLLLAVGIAAVGFVRVPNHAHNKK